MKWLQGRTAGRCYGVFGLRLTRVKKDHPIHHLQTTDRLAGCQYDRNEQPDMTVVAQATNGRSGCAAHRKIRPDVVLMDISQLPMSARCSDGDPGGVPRRPLLAQYL